METSVSLGSGRSNPVGGSGPGTSVQNATSEAKRAGNRTRTSESCSFHTVRLRSVNKGIRQIKKTEKEAGKRGLSRHINQ